MKHATLTNSNRETRQSSTWTIYNQDWGATAAGQGPLPQYLIAPEEMAFSSTAAPIQCTESSISPAAIYIQAGSSTKLVKSGWPVC
jgi:hypothetical protein